jgi:arylsulfatase
MALALLTLSSLQSVVAAASAKPNVLIVMTDDQGLGDFSSTGNPVLKTPNFDAFAQNSVRLTDFHVSPMCSPTRGQLLTGLAAVRNGATSVTAGRTFLRPGLPTMPEVFRQAGYRTGIFGKWHLGDTYPHRPMDKGFEECDYHLGWGLLNSTPEFDMPLFDGRYFHNGEEQRFAGHCTDLWFDRAMAWMKQCKSRGEPFFCYLPTNAPHAPCIDRDEYIAPYRKPGMPAGFFGMIAHLDARFGDLQKFLSEQELERDTIVIFMTDNGGTAGAPVFNAGLRAGKTTYYDGGHRVPCWIRWPNGKLGEPREIATPTQNTDLLPTLCDLCAIEPPKRDVADQPYLGVSLANVLRGAQPDPGDRKFVVQYGQDVKKFDSCVVWGKWRLVKGDELYDVESDRAQRTNLIESRRDVAQALRHYYEGWWRGVESTINDFVPISIGATQQPLLELTSGDWEGIYADNTGYVREAVGGPTGGHWNILVERPGEYEFVLRRWPAQTGAALGEKYEPNERSPSYNSKATKGFPTIATAQVDIAGVHAATMADPNAKEATLTMNLPAGRTKLNAWFSDASGIDLCGAFFVTVRKK